MTPLLTEIDLVTPSDAVLEQDVTHDLAELSCWNQGNAEDIGFTAIGIIAPSGVVNGAILEAGAQRLIRDEEFGDNQMQLAIMDGADFFATRYIQAAGLNLRNQRVNAKISRYEDVEQSGDKTVEDALVSLMLTGKQFEGKDVEILEDLIDKGFTLDAAITALYMLGARSVHLTTLSRKDGTSKVDLSAARAFSYTLNMEALSAAITNANNETTDDGDEHLHDNTLSIEYADDESVNVKLKTKFKDATKQTYTVKRSIEGKQLGVVTNLLKLPDIWIAGAGMDCGIENYMRKLGCICVSWKRSLDKPERPEGTPQHWWLEDVA